MAKPVMTRWILILWSKAKTRISSQALATFCGKVRHKATECWSRDRASNKGSGRNSSANVTSSGKDKSVGKGTEGVKGHSKGQGKSKSKGKGKGKSKGRKGFQSGRPDDSLEFEEEPWDETNQTEPGEWWNSWADGAEPN